MPEARQKWNLDPARVAAAARAADDLDARAASAEESARLHRAQAASIRTRWGIEPSVTDVTDSAREGM